MRTSGRSELRLGAWPARRGGIGALDPGREVRIGTIPRQGPRSPDPRPAHAPAPDSVPVAWSRTRRAVFLFVGSTWRSWRVSFVSGHGGLRTDGAVQSGQDVRLGVATCELLSFDSSRSSDSVVAAFVRGAVLGTKDGARRNQSREVSSLPAEAGRDGLFGCGAFIASRLVLMSTRSEAHSEGMGRCSLHRASLRSFAWGRDRGCLRDLRGPSELRRGAPQRLRAT